MKDKTTYKKRSFLNPDEGIAAISAHVSVEDEPTSTHVSATLILTDCSDSVHLDFDNWSSSEDVKYLRNRRKKLKLLRDTVNEFADAVEAAYKEIEDKAPAKKAEAKRLKAERKKKKK